MFNELKKFLMRGNVVDLAVGVVVGGAFGGISKSLVDDIIMPPLGLLLGHVDFTNLFITLREGSPTGPYVTLEAAKVSGAVTLRYGLFLNSILVFLLTGTAIFFLVKAINKLQSPEAAPDTRQCPRCCSSVAKRATRCPACTSDLEVAEV